MTKTAGKPESRPVHWIAILLLGAAWLLPVILAGRMVMGERAPALDEFEFARDTRWVAQGMVPYRDFWEHHVPLVWGLFSPVVMGDGPQFPWAILKLRLVQLVLLVALFVVLERLLRRMDLGVEVRWAILLLLASSPGFLSFAVEYRLDVPANLLFFLSLLAAEASLVSAQGTWPLRLAAGAALAAACVSSPRIVPVALAAIVLYVLTGSEGWGLRRRSLPFLAGGALVAAVFCGFFLLAGGLGALWRDVVVHNVTFEAASHAAFPWYAWLGDFMRVHDFLSPLLLLAGFVGALFHLARFRAPTTGFRLAVLFLIQFVVLAKTSTPYLYQFQTLFLLSALLVGCLLVKVPPGGVGKSVAPALALLSVCGLMLSLPRLGDWRSVTLYQNHVIERVLSLTQPEECVLDGGSFVLDRPPAARTWFLPLFAEVHMDRGDLPMIDPQAVRRARPAVVVADLRLMRYLDNHPATADFLTSNYLPLERAIWIPAASACLTDAKREATWTILHDGVYVLKASRRLADLAWFADPLGFSRVHPRNPRQAGLDLRKMAEDPGVAWAVDGQPVPPGTPSLTLRVGQALSARLTAEGPMGALAVPKRFPVLFQCPYSWGFLEAPFGL